MPFFSIIIPLYNKEPYVLETLISVKQQNFKDYEVIIINDGSTDHSKNIAENYIKHFEKASLINQKNKGLSYSRNIGIKNAKGKVIAFLDADDKWLPDYLKTIYNLYNTFTDASVFGTDYFEIRNEKSLIPKKNISKTLKNTSFLIENFFKANLHQPIICPSNICVKTAVFEHVLFNENIDFAEDLDFYLNLFTKGYKMAYAFKPLCYIFKDVPNQMTQTSIKGKRIPDFDSYEIYANTDKHLKNYLDFNRYTFASKYKLLGEKKQFEKIRKHITTDNLNLKQRFLLNSPTALFKIIVKFKTMLLCLNIRLTSY